MTLRRRFLTLFAAVAFATVGMSVAQAEDGWTTIFDGKTLKGWDGDPKFWSVKDGTIHGQTTKDNPTQGNTFIIWNKGETADFELKLEYKIVGGNSGIQYRSFKKKGDNDGWRIGGYQADFEAGDRYSGILYGEAFRGILSDRGNKTVLTREDKKLKLGVTKIGDSNEIGKAIKKEDWNSYHITAKGFHFTHRINDVVTMECIDNDEDQRRPSGLLALQLHAGPPMVVQFRNIRIKHLKSGDSTSSVTRLAPTTFVSFKKKETKKVIFVAGTKSHGYGSHEHFAGCTLLAEALNESGLPIEASVIKDGWPKDASVLSDADSIVVYADGGGRHPFHAHIDQLDVLMKKGIGLVCIHYGVEIPAGKSGDAFLDWTGGFFETNWSVNPHWTADYDKFPEHAITNGVKPFTINDEWYYHMRFVAKMDGVTPILTDLPPTTTLVKADGSLARPDNAHNNNPQVRAAVLERKEEQHMAWARQRPDGGRGFGFTGGHNHWNWGNNEFRKLVLNAIVWTANSEVPSDGVPSKPLTVEDLMVNQDYDVPGNFNPERIKAMLTEWNN